MEPALWGLIVLPLLLLLSGFFSAARTALGSVRRQHMKELAEKGDRRAELVLTIAEDSFRVLSTFRLAILVTNFLIAGLVALIVVPPLAAWLAQTASILIETSYIVSYLAAVPLAALLTFILVEALPEMAAQRQPAAVAMTLAGPARITLAVLSPLVSAVSSVRRNLLAPPGSDRESIALVTEQEIMTLVDAGEEEGSIEQEEKEMIYSIFQLDETLAREIMVPRIDVVALDISTRLEDARKVIIEAGHSRIPVYEDSLDHVRGLLYAKDLLEVWDSGADEVALEKLLRPPMFVPESKRVSDLLHELQNSKVHMAIVIDEYGGTAGLVTIEDIVEEIVGEIFDEYDEAVENPYEMISGDEYVFDARIDLDDFNRLLGTDLPTELGDTLGGFIYGQLGKVPAPGEIVETEQIHIEVISVADRRIRKVRVIRTQPQQGSGSEEHQGNGDQHERNGNGR